LSDAFASGGRAPAVQRRPRHGNGVVDLGFRCRRTIAERISDRGLDHGLDLVGRAELAADEQPCHHDLPW
jgi:hypothetical protein